MQQWTVKKSKIEKMLTGFMVINFHIYGLYRYLPGQSTYYGFSFLKMFRLAFLLKPLNAVLSQYTCPCPSHGLCIPQKKSGYAIYMHDRTIYAGSVLGLLHHVYVRDVANIL
jgi:hypothetical protein